MENITIKAPCGEIQWLIPQHIVKETFTKLDDVNDAKRHTVLLVENFSINNEPITSLVDLTQLKEKVTKEVRDYIDSDEASSTCRAAAILVKNSLSRIVGNVFIKVTKSKYPVKLFTDEAKAVNWLKKVIEIE